VLRRSSALTIGIPVEGVAALDGLTTGEPAGGVAVLDGFMNGTPAGGVATASLSGATSGTGGSIGRLNRDARFLASFYDRVAGSRSCRARVRTAPIDAGNKNTYVDPHCAALCIDEHRRRSDLLKRQHPK